MVDVVEKFLTIIPREHTYTRYESLYERSVTYTVEPIPLNVVKSSGVDMTPDVKVNVTDLNDGYKMFLNVSGKGDKFKVQAIFDENVTVHAEGDMAINTNYTPSGVINSIHLVREFRVLELLDYWFKNRTTFSVVTRAVDIPDGLYKVTGNPSRKQTFEGYTIWEIEFTRFEKLTWGYFKNDNAGVTQAKKRYENSKKKNSKSTQTKTTKAKQSSMQKKLQKCTLCKIKYTKNSDNTCICTMYMQKVLEQKGFYKSTVDGWFGTKTTEAVKKFQKKYKKTYKLTVNGKVDKATLNAICKV